MDLHLDNEPIPSANSESYVDLILDKKLRFNQVSDVFRKKLFIWNSCSPSRIFVYCIFQDINLLHLKPELLKVKCFVMPVLRSGLSEYLFERIISCRMNGGRIPRNAEYRFNVFIHRLSHFISGFTYFAVHVLNNLPGELFDASIAHIKSRLKQAILQDIDMWA